MRFPWGEKRIGGHISVIDRGFSMIIGQNGFSAFFPAQVWEGLHEKELYSDKRESVYEDADLRGPMRFL
ncbi:MAG: hypothetical protein GX061_01040 [Eubacteriaceae bacterium]|nr:hypothetical protein [Eubacteriaceae bacterium]